METHLKHLNLIAQTQGEKEKKDLPVIPMMKAQVNKLILGSGIEVTLEKQLLVILMLVWELEVQLLMSAYMHVLVSSRA